MDPLSRRNVLTCSASLAAALRIGQASPASAAKTTPLKIVVAGGHPDDPESGCGGTMARLSAAGHSVVALYLTRGEAGIPGKSNAEAARTRTAESGKACLILGARPVFAGQVDGATEINRERYAAFARLLAAENPDVVFTHWPIDTHPDHRAASLLVYHAWSVSKKKFHLFYYEVLTGEQTQNFSPSDYVDVTDTWERKKEACYAHQSQNPAEFYARHEDMERFRGREFGCSRAEAFVAFARNGLSLPR